MVEFRGILRTGIGEHTQLDHESNEAERISVHYDASYIS